MSCRRSDPSVRNPLISLTLAIAAFKLRLQRGIARCNHDSVVCECRPFIYTLLKQMLDAQLLRIHSSVRNKSTEKGDGESLP
jgi:hypothetical protein